MSEEPLSAPRPLATPDRGELLEAHRREDRRSAVWLLGELAAAGGCLALATALGGPAAPLEAGILAALAAVGLFDGLPAIWAANRKRLDRVRDDARFGPHSRDSLLAAVDRVAARLGIRAPCPVYLVRDKEVNAAALPLSLLPGVGSFAAVHLNRSVLHLLDEEEVESVIGHEFGHVFAFAPLAGRCLAVHAAFAAAVTFALATILAGSDLRYGSPLLALWPARWLAFGTTLSRTRSTEFLCDDCGATAAGTAPAMRAQIKLALEEEVRTTLVEQVLEAMLRGGDVPAAKLLETYEAALPFGAVASAEAGAALRAGIGRLTRGHAGLSLGGFWRFVFSGDDVDEDAVRALLRRGRAVRGVRLVSVRPRDVILGRAALDRCLEAIEAEPTSVLVHLPAEIDDRGDTHPNCSRRLLFLWRSRGPRETAGGGTSAA